MHPPNKALTAASAVAFVLVLALTPLGPTIHAWLMEGLSRYIGPRRVAAILNVLLFVPVGLVLGWLRRPRALILAPIGSALIETAQLFLPGRHSDPVDVVTNSLGAVLGYAAVGAWRVLRHSPSGPSPAPALPVSTTPAAPAATRHASRTRVSGGATDPRRPLTLLPDPATRGCHVQVQANAEVSASQVGEQVMLLDASGRELVTLNDLGSSVWWRITDPIEPHNLIQHLSAEYPEVSRAALERDITAFIDELVARDLAQRVEAAPSAEPPG